MIYTIVDSEGREQTYEGFRSYKVPETLINDEILVIVEWDGEPDVWVIENEASINELARMYRMMQCVDLVPKHQFDHFHLMVTFPVPNPHRR